MENQVDQLGFLFPSEFQHWPPSAINSFSYPNINDQYNPTMQSNSLIYRTSLYDPLGFGGLYNMGSSSGSLSTFGSIHAEKIGKMSAQEIMDAKVQAALKSHSEAERRRRERINGHLGRLRSLLPSTTKTDKATLLAEVIQHVRELKRQKSELAKDNPLPTDIDELTIDTMSCNDDDDGRFLIKVSLCCDDRSDLISDLVQALKSLKLRTLKAEITVLGGRVRNVLVITGEDECEENRQLRISSIQDALNAVMQRSAVEDSHSAGGIKRQRTNNLSSLMLQQRSF